MFKPLTLAFTALVTYIYDAFSCWWQDFSTRLCDTPVCAAAAPGFGIFHFIWDSDHSAWNNCQLTYTLHSPEHTHTHFNPRAKLVWPSQPFLRSTVKQIGIKSNSERFESECEKFEICFWNQSIYWAFSFYLFLFLGVSHFFHWTLSLKCVKCVLAAMCWGRKNKLSWSCLIYSFRKCLGLLLVYLIFWREDKKEMPNTFDAFMRKSYKSWYFICFFAFCPITP